VQTVIKGSSLHRNFIYIIAHFGTLSESVTKLETRGQSLSESLRILENIRVLINKAPNEIGIAINKKMENILNKNKGLKIL
jgi:exonuclease VII small subunit